MSDLVTTDQLLERYAPLFARIAEGALERERDRVLPFEQIGWIKESGFLALRVPREFGGDGARLPQLFRLLVELAAADPHIPQAGRELIHARLEETGRAFEWHEFNAAHAFLRDEGPRYNPALARVCMAILLRFLGECLD